MKMFILGFILVTGFAFAHEHGHELPLTNYVKMQETLAADNFKDSLALHQVICGKELQNFKGSYKDCGKTFKTIEELRTSFKKLSDVYMGHGNKREMNDLQKASCPMAEAKWVQKKGELRNPYYGKSMLECGEKI